MAPPDPRPDRPANGRTTARTQPSARLPSACRATSALRVRDHANRCGRRHPPGAATAHIGIDHIVMTDAPVTQPDNADITLWADHGRDFYAPITFANLSDSRMLWAGLAEQLGLRAGAAHTTVARPAVERAATRHDAARTATPTTGRGRGAGADGARAADAPAGCARREGRGLPCGPCARPPMDGATRGADRGAAGGDRAGAVQGRHGGRTRGLRPGKQHLLRRSHDARTRVLRPVRAPRRTMYVPAN